MQKNFYIGFFCQYVLLCVIFIVLYHVNICHALLNRLDFFLINKHLFMPHICSACTFTDIKQKNSLFLFKAISYMNSFFVLLLAENILNCCRKVTAQGNYWLCFKSIIFTCYYTKELTSCFLSDQGRQWPPPVTIMYDTEQNYVLKALFLCKHNVITSVNSLEFVPFV